MKLLVLCAIVVLFSCEQQTTMSKTEVKNMCDSLINIKLRDITHKIDSIKAEQDTINAYLNLKDSLNFKFLFTCIQQIDQKTENY